LKAGKACSKLVISVPSTYGVSYDQACFRLTCQKQPSLRKMSKSRLCILTQENEYEDLVEEVYHDQETYVDNTCQPWINTNSWRSLI